MNSRISSSDRGSVIAEYALQLSLFLFLLLAGITALKGGVEEIYWEASLAMQGNVQVAMVTSMGGTDGPEMEQNSGVDTQEYTETGESNNSGETTRGSENGPPEDPHLGGGTMATRPTEIPRVLDGGDGKGRAEEGSTQRTYY
ncbi:MAG: hypothetical protein KDD66_07455 [Bdellovibrionales bacterium]|nr:hypothetical protein [Bdellovibrionales bacterium]